jgi:type I restriction enzyme, S subunit
LREKDFSDYTISGAQGSANQASITLDHTFNFGVLISKSQEQFRLYQVFNFISHKISKLKSENYFLSSFKELLLSKLATIES